jgi:PAS domain S-box-containing protein
MGLCWLPLLLLAVAWLGTPEGLVLGAAAMPAFLTALWISVHENRGTTVPSAAVPNEPDGGQLIAEEAGRPPPSPAQTGEAALTRSGLYDSPDPLTPDSTDGLSSGTFSIVDMVSRLDPEHFRWIHSSLAEQQFLGWSLAELEQMSFLDIVEAEDRPQAERSLRRAVTEGELHGLIVRIRTARGKLKAIEVHVGARYSADRRVTYLRCHLTDVTEKLRTERERRLRTQELSRVNEQLRRINHELSELKDRYRDLYENAPAMYFSLDGRGRLVECNQAFLKALDRPREQLIGQGFETFVDPTDLERCRSLFRQLLETGSIETESRWIKAGGRALDVWISGAVMRGPRGDVRATRCVAQDLTAKHLLEAELRETNRSLARANQELSARNRELDEFVYVVSHDLQEPVRSLIAFSNFLLEDYGPKLDAEGKEHLQRLSAAAHRMRAMIQGLLNLSRAGRVIDESGPVDLGELVEVIRADLGELLRSRGGELRLLSPGAVLWGDRRRLQQLLTNLIANGIKYNRGEVPTVEVGLAPVADGLPAGPSVTLLVRDNGIGIDPRHHQKILLPFRRLHTQEEFPGTGVGLALCIKIVEAHGGRIRVESQSGCGATFFVSLPIGPGLPPGPESPSGVLVEEASTS